MRSLLRRIRDLLSGSSASIAERESTQLLLGRLLAQTVRHRGAISSLEEVEFKVFSQWGDDGIIQWLVHAIEMPSRTFIEFGVQDYRESNTRFLLMNDGWSGLVIDGSEEQVRRITESEYFWRHDLTAKAAFIDASNIDGIIRSWWMDAPRNLGLLHIDLDGNDYWIWKAITAVEPAVVIIEYNAVFGADRAISIPYDPAFVRTNAHWSNLYWGASLRALGMLAAKKGYAFIGCNGAGNNAYFVRRDRLVDSVRERSLQDGFVDSKFRESRDRAGALTHLRGSERLACIRGLPVVNVETGATEAL